ncbi:MAG: hypothetical protein AAF624_10225 [Bacteroidota bacterium]
MRPTELLTVRRLAPFACARVGAVVYAVLGVLVGVVLAFTMPVVTTFWSDFAEVQVGAMLASVLVLPLLSAVGGFVAGWVFALVFNGVARWTGGVRVTVERTIGEGATQAAPPPASSSASPPAVPDEASW